MTKFTKYTICRLCDFYHRPKPKKSSTFVQNSNSTLLPTVQMTTQDFKDKVFDYTTSKEWVFKGDKLAIIDFYADWCQPCKMIAPILEKLSDKYGDDLVICKVDTESEMELSQVFGIRSIPTMLFIPVGKQPMIQPGALPENVLEEVIEKELLPTTTEA